MSAAPSIALTFSSLPQATTGRRRPTASDRDAFRLWMAVRDERPRPIRYPAESRRIMVGVDFSRASDLAVNLVSGIAATTQTVIDLVHVFDGFDEAFVRGNRAILDRVDAVAGQRGPRAARARWRPRPQGVRCVSTSLVGAPGSSSPATRRDTGADLLVLGVGAEAAGRSGAPGAPPPRRRRCAPARGSSAR